MLLSTSDSHYERGESIVYDGANYWMFYGRHTSFEGNYGSGTPDDSNYALYYKKASSIAGLASAEATQISDAGVNIFQGQTSAAYFNSKVWVFAAQHSYSYAIKAWTTTDGSSWTTVDPGIAVGMPHQWATVWGNKLVLAYCDGSWIRIRYTTDGTTWTQGANVVNKEGMPRLFNDDGTLYCSHTTWGNPGEYWIYKLSGDLDTGNWSTTYNIHGGVGWYPCDPYLEKVGTDYLFFSADMVADKSRQFIQVFKSSTVAAFDGMTTSTMVTNGGSASDASCDMWPVVINADSSSYLFYTSERGAPIETISGTGNIWYFELDWNTDNDHYDYIQPAIDKATETTINVAAGTYDEQVVINKDLTLQGAGDTTIIKPSQTTANNFRLFNRTVGGPANSAPIVVTDGAGNTITIKNLKIDGSSVTSLPAGADRFAGIQYRGTAGIIDSVTVNGINVTDKDDGIYLSPLDKTVTIEVKSCTVSGYKKNGITANGAGLTANIHDNTVTGMGPIRTIAQNGIQIGVGATGTVKNNTVKNNAWIYPGTGIHWGAAGILLYNSGATVEGNIVTDCQIGIAAQADSGSHTPTIEGNKVSATGLAGSGVIDVVGINGATWDDEVSINAIIKGNDLSGGGPGHGIETGALERDGPKGTVNATISNNTVSGWLDGIWLGLTSNEVTVTGNTITNNVELVSGVHIIPVVNVANVHVNFNNIVGNQGYGVYNGGTGTLDATNNWWGANDGPAVVVPGSGDKVSANVDYDPWLKLNISANPTSIVANGTSTSTITADMTENSDNATPSGGHIPDGTKIIFTTDKGSIGSLTVDKTTTNGKATATLTSSKIVETANVIAAAPGYDPYNKASTTVFFTPAGSASTAANTNLGAVNFSPSNGFISAITTISTGNMQYLPAGYSFPYGFFGFNINNLTPGGSTQVTINFPNPLPLGVKYFKIQNGQAVDCSSIMTRPEPYTIILRLTDGGVGDADGIANGTIVDPGGPAFPMSATPTSHQSSMPIMPQAPVQLSNINVKTAALSATKVSPGSQVTVTANVANTGTGNGSSLIKFYVNGSEEYSQPVTVNSGGSTTVTHDIIRNEPGTYTVYVNGTNAGSFTVDMFAGNDMLIYGIIALFMIGIIGTLYLLVRRRPD